MMVNVAIRKRIAERRASAAYATATLSSGADAASFLGSMAQQADNHVDVCCQVPEEAVADDSTDGHVRYNIVALVFRAR